VLRRRTSSRSRLAAAVCVLGSALVVGAAILQPPAAGAAAPTNDLRAGATPLGALPATASGTTEGAGVEDDPSPSCSGLRGGLWYRLDTVRRGPVFVRLEALGDLEAVLVVYRRGRSELTPILCRTTDKAGVSALAFRASRNASYLILVGQRLRSAAGRFRLSVLRPERPARPPGDALPEGGVNATVDALRDPDDAWSVDLPRGSMYRINLVSRGRRCLPLALYRPTARSFALDRPIRTQRCGRYLAFTPGPDGGGRYSLLVRPERGRRGAQSYRLEVARAEPDDTAPGFELGNGVARTGSLDGAGIDVVDLYRFAVPRAGELTTIDLRTAKDSRFDVLVMRLSGERVLCECSARGRVAVRRELAPGHYYVAVRSRERSRGSYGLTVLVRSIMTTDVLISGSRFVESDLGVPVTIAARVAAPGPGGVVRLQLDRLDPLAGWQFFLRLPLRVDATGVGTASWLPPSIGHWRLRARFLGTRFSSTSASRTVRLLVSEPLEAEPTPGR
jgi:hypothetical protein